MSVAALRSIRRALARRPEIAARLQIEGVPLNDAVDAAAKARAEAGGTLATAASIAALGVSRPLAAAIESIILEIGRPTLFITNGDFEPPEDEVLAARLANARPLLRPAIAAVGRIEIDDGFRRYPGGTGWLVADGVVITNRHVAEQFVSSGAGDAPDFLKDFRGRTYKVNIDFFEEHGLPGEKEIRLTKVIYMAARGGDVPDVALFEVDRSTPLPSPIPLVSGAAKRDMWIGVIGYPLPDYRVPLESRSAEERYFGNVYGVKRLAPGLVKPPVEGGAVPWLIAHDATTLGGNSGSAVIDLETGAAVGLHFAGTPKIENHAISASALAEILSAVRTPATFISLRPGDFTDPNHGETITEAPSDAAVAALREREGYDDTFIKPGDPAFTIPLPAITDAAPGDIAMLDEGGDELKYLHFSVKMNVARRLCYFSAVNIDGKRTFSIKGERPGWKFDSRFADPAIIQIKNECYGREQDGKFSRGHMTRREDPNWGGDRSVAETANSDTFYVTNACPQFQPFNAGIWLSLEDYALENADQDDMRISVFTGPIFTEEDPEFFGVKIPIRFWKIIAFSHDETKELAATGYIMSQEDLMPSSEEFVYGQHRSSQVTIGSIERLTGLDFHQLKDFDPLATDEEGVVERPLRSPLDLVFRKRP